MAIKAVYGLLTAAFLFGALSSSTNYKLNDYSVGGGGTGATSSANYTAQGSVSETAGAKTSSTNYAVKSGSIEARQAYVPAAPTLSNGSGTYYNKLNFIINTSSNPSDATYSVAVSTTSNFLVTNYVQASGALGSTPVYQTYAAWGGASGTMATGLLPNTTYYFKVNASQGKYTVTGYGPSANVATVSPSISFSLSPSTMNMGSLTSGSVISSPSNISLTFATNAGSGGTIYMAGSSTGLRSATSSNYTIAVSPPSGDLSSLSEGFGLQNVTPSSPMVSQSPYNGGGNVVGAIYTTFQPIYSATGSVSSGTSTSVLKAKASITTPASTDYTNTLTFIASASY